MSKCLLDFPWSKEVEQHLKDSFHLAKFRPLQLWAINLTLSGKDLFLVMPTGRGKSLCYQLPAVCSKGSSRSEVLSTHTILQRILLSRSNCKIVLYVVLCMYVRFYVGCHSPGVPDGGPDHVPEVYQGVSSCAKCI